MPEPPQEASANLRQIEIPYVRQYRPRYTQRTGRVVQFATRVTPEFDQEIRAIGSQENIHLAEVLERMLLIYQAESKNYNFQHKDNKLIVQRERERERESKITSSRGKSKKAAAK